MPGVCVCRCALCQLTEAYHVQVLGGYGYTRDFDVEQLYRDNRLNMIHEGERDVLAHSVHGSLAPILVYWPGHTVVLHSPHPPAPQAPTASRPLTCSAAKCLSARGRD